MDGLKPGYNCIVASRFRQKVNFAVKVSLKHVVKVPKTCREKVIQIKLGKFQMPIGKKYYEHLLAHFTFETNIRLKKY